MHPKNTEIFTDDFTKKFDISKSETKMEILNDKTWGGFFGVKQHVYMYEDAVLH